MFARTVFDVSDDEYDTFEIEFPWLVDGHLKTVNEAGEPLEIGEVTYDKETRQTTITLAEAYGDDEGKEVIILRQTPIPENLDDFIKSKKDSEYATSIAMGLQPAGLSLLYIIQELSDRIKLI